MICFRDRTYCSFHEPCAKSTTCGRALTKDIKKAAEDWWGGPDPPFCLFVNVPECFEPVVEEAEDDGMSITF